MGRASAAKKVRRAARTGGGGAGSARPKIGFPLLVGAVVLIGVSVVAFARLTNDQADAAPPTLADHWHSAYGVYVCDQFLPPFSSTNDPQGIHSHQDGLIHIHPFSNLVTGEDATLGVFLEATGVSISDTELDTGDGTVRVTGDDCGGEPAVLQVARWASANATDIAPEVFTEGFADIGFSGDGQAFTIALVPAGADIPPPPSTASVDNPSDLPGSPPTVPGNQSEGTPAADPTVPAQP